MFALPQIGRTFRRTADLRLFSCRHTCGSDGVAVVFTGRRESAHLNASNRLFKGILGNLNALMLVSPDLNQESGPEVSGCPCQPADEKFVDLL